MNSASSNGQRKIVADDYEFWRNYAWCDEYVIYDRFGYKYKKIVVKKSLRGTLARFRKYLLSKGNYEMSWIIPGIRHLSMYYRRERP